MNYLFLFDYSDPYCLISCNGTTVQTSVQWATLNPEFKESFEIDVTNPGQVTTPKYLKFSG